MPDPLLISAAQMQRFAARCDYMAIAPALNAAALEFGILTPRQIRHWLGQAYVETAGFTVLSENLDYSAERLVAVWPNRFPTIVEAAHFAHNPQQLAEKVYGGRLGNNQLGDGWRFRGGGLFDTTGRANYARASALLAIDLVTNPDPMRTDWKVAARAGGAFWHDHDLNAVVAADPDEHAAASIAHAINQNEADDVRAETRIINGGLTGLDVRLQQTLRAAMIWRDPT